MPNEEPSTAFTDLAGDPWNIDLTVNAIRRVRAGTGANLMADIGQTVELLRDDPLTILDLVYFACADRATELAIPNREAFAERIGPETLGPMTDAFLAALTFFFRRYRPEYGAIVTTATNRARQNFTRMTRTLAQTMTPERINQAIDAHFNQLENDLLAPGKPSTT